MENFWVCVNAVLPIFLLLMLGYLAKCMKLLTRPDVAKFNKVAFKFFLPGLLFYSVYTSDLSSAFRPRLILFALLGVTFAFGFSLVLAHFVAKRQNQKGVISQAIFRSNFAIIGLPIAQSLCPDADLGCIALLLSIVVPYYNVLAVIVLSIYGDAKPNFKNTLINILKNPLIISSFVALLILALGIQLPVPVEKAIKQLSQAASPLMLFLLGAFFEFDSMKSEVRELWVSIAARLIIMPAFVLAAAWALGFRGVELAGMMGVFASSSAVASFTMAQQMGGDAELAGNLVVMTSALCPFTLFLWSFLFKSLGAF